MPSRWLPATALLIALSAAAAFGQSASETDALETRATELFTAGKNAESIAAFEQVRAARHAAGDQKLEARALFRLAVGYRGAGRTEDARRAAKEAYRLASVSGDDAIAAEALGQMYQTNSYLPAFPDAARTLEEAVRLARSANQPRTLARILDSRARWLSDNGRLDEGIATISEAITHAQAAGDLQQLAALYSVRSTLVSRSGFLGDALADAMRARDVGAKVGPRGELSGLYALAQSQSHLSNSEEAIRLWTEVLDRYRTLGPPIGVAIAIDSRCHVQYDAGHFEASLADAKAAIEAFTALKQRPSSASYSRAGMASIRLGRDTEARQWLAQAETQVVGSPDFEQAQTWTQLGISYNLLGDPDNARRAYGKLLEIGRRRGSLEDEWKGEFGLGRAALVAHDPDGAITHLERAVSLIEQLRSTVPAQEIRAAYLSRRVEAHEWLTAALMMQSTSPSDRFVEQAFNTAERARVRALTDLLAEGRARRQGSQKTDPPRVRTRADIAANLGPGDLLVEYLVGEEHAYGWVLSRSALIGFELPAPADLDATVRRALAYIDADDREGLQRLAEDFTPALLGPALSQLGSVQRIIFVPDGPLQRLPFAALPLSAERTSYLAQKAAVSTVGSGSLLDMLKRAEPTHGVLALASTSADSASPSQLRSTDAPLLEVSGEVEDTIRMLTPDGGGRAITDASELGVKTSGFADYRVIHVAAHSLIDESLPRNSAILLRPEGNEDGALRAAEISQLPVRADLVVLAACRTQFGRILRGEGFLSLARSFMEAGARSVVASLWDVGDRDTRVLMRGFYAGVAAGLPPDEALRVSQLQMIRAGGTLASPKVWAAFQVAGEARQPVWPRQPIPKAAIAIAVAMLAALVVVARM